MTLTTIALILGYILVGFVVGFWLFVGCVKDKVNEGFSKEGAIRLEQENAFVYIFLGSFWPGALTVFSIIVLYVVIGELLKRVFGKPMRKLLDKLV